VPTASKVVNGREDVAPETRRRVTGALDRLGHIRRPRFDAAKVPGLVDLVVHSLASSWSGAVLHGVEAAAHDVGLEVIVSAVSGQRSAVGASNGCGCCVVCPRHPPERHHNAYMDDDWRQQIDALHEELVRRDDPAAWVREQDAMEASLRYPEFALRGPVFGVAVQDPEAGPEWRVLKPVVDPMPQMARDALQSYLFFTAKDDTDDRAVRRELLAAVRVLEREPVNEVTACGVRYRVVRGDEFARAGEDGLEPPRPTDPEPLERVWERRPRAAPSRDIGFVLDPRRVDGPAAGALKLGLRDFAYSGARFPSAVRADSERAVGTHPELVFLPAGFGLVERGDHRGWCPRGALMPTPHDARRMFYDGMAETWALLYKFDEATKARYAAAAEEFRALGRADEFRVVDRLFRICRIERMVRMGAKGPETPRPSDVDQYGPMKMHPTMDEDGTLTYGD